MEATEHSLGPQTTPTPFVPFKPTEQRYWELRHLLWSRFDAGIRMDEEGWYSVTAVLMLVACFLLFLLRLGAPLIAARGFLAFRCLSGVNGGTDRSTLPRGRCCS